MNLITVICELCNSIIGLLPKLLPFAAIIVVPQKVGNRG